MIRYPVWGNAGMPEYGDPELPSEFAALYSTSPYHRVTEGVHYPTFFLTVSTGDERVTPFTARSWLRRSLMPRAEATSS